MLSPDSLVAYLPVAVFHDPRPVRHVSPGQIRSGMNRLSFQELLSLCLETCPPGVPRAPLRDRFTALGRHLQALAAIPSHEFSCFIGDALIRKLRLWREAVHRARQTIQEPPALFVEDGESFIEQFAEAVVREDYLVPDELSGTGVDEGIGRAQALIGKFGLLLDVWIDLFSAARRLRASNGGGQPSLLRR